MNVLVVEDDTDKLRRLVQVLLRAGIAEDAVSEARSSQQAKTLLRDQQFGLMLLDLNLPKRIHEEPERGEGLHLLQELTERARYNKPSHVIGVTAYDNELATAQPVFDAALVPIFRYDRGSDSWELPLQRRVEYLRQTVLPATNSSEVYDYDIAVLTALNQPELGAVLDLPWDWSDQNFPNDDTTYHLGSAPGRESPRRVVACHAPFVGMPVAGIIATKLIQHFRPKYLIHVGIAAAVRGQAEIGDVLVADPSWDWGSGKFALNEAEVVFYAAPYQIPLVEEVRGLIRRLSADEVALAKIRSEWRGAKPPTVLNVRLGPVASGASVLADGVVKDRIRDQHRKLLGIEMETYAVLAAAQFSGRPRPSAMSLKSVCDFADGEKNDEFQAYAAYTSARTLELLVARYL